MQDRSRGEDKKRQCKTEAEEKIRKDNARQKQGRRLEKTMQDRSRGEDKKRKCKTEAEEKIRKDNARQKQRRR